MDTPERVLGDFRGINITGCLMPVWKDTEQPVMTQIPGVDAYFISVFDNEKALHKQTAFVVIGNYVTHSEHDGTPVVNIDYPKECPYKIKQITDGQEFVESILVHPKIRIMLNPRIVEGKTHWTEVTLPEKL